MRNSRGLRESREQEAATAALPRSPLVPIGIRQAPTTTEKAPRCLTSQAHPNDWRQRAATSIKLKSLSSKNMQSRASSNPKPRER